MLRVICVLLLSFHLSAFAFQDLCELTPGQWKGWVKTDFIKWKARGRVEHVSGTQYVISGSIPDLGLKGTYHFSCANSAAHHSKLKKPLYFKQSGSKITADYKQDKYKAHFEHHVGRLNFFNSVLGLGGDFSSGI